MVGAPYNDDGSPGTHCTPATDAFAAELGAAHGLPVERVDERYSSQRSRRAAARAAGPGQRRKRRCSKGDMDSAAAAIILERWLEGEGHDESDSNDADSGAPTAACGTC